MLKDAPLAKSTERKAAVAHVELPISAGETGLDQLTALLALLRDSAARLAAGQFARPASLVAVT
jgi:hypothetical protein